MKLMRLVDRLWIAWQIIRGRAVSVSQQWNGGYSTTTVMFDSRTISFDGLPMNRRALKAARKAFPETGDSDHG